MKPATLMIRSDTPGLAFAIHNSALERVEAGTTPAEISLEPGLYMVKATHIADGSLQPQFANLEEGSRWVVQLGPSTISSEEDTRTVKGRAVDAVTSLFSRQVPSQTPGVSSSLPPIWLRFRKLKGWTESEPVQPQKKTVRVDNESVWIDFELPVNAVVFAQVIIEGQPPLNTALPGGGTFKPRPCSLRLKLVNGRLQSEAHLSNIIADNAAEYLRRGNFDEASRILQTLSPPSGSFLAKALNYLTARFSDPAVSALGRYVLLRTGQLTWLKNFPEALLTLFDWLADGKIISGELAAREGKPLNALQSFIQIQEGHLPLYTDGFSMLLSRLMQYTLGQDRQMQSLDEEMEALIAKVYVPQAKKLLASLQRWAPFLDMNALTLTFSGIDIANPSEIQYPVEPDADWWKLEPTVAAPPYASANN